MISIVVPIYNEEGNIEKLLMEVKSVLPLLGIEYEMILVDDGSTDRTLEILKAAARKDPAVKVVRFKRNFGQSAAMSAGIERASGEYIVTLDADLQNDPRDIPKLLERIKAGGCDIVSGWRKDRKDSFLTRVLVSRAANAMISWITGVKLHDYGCTLKIYKAEVLKNVMLYGELHRFLPALASWQGAKIEELVVQHRKRQTGKSKYGLTRIYRVLFDLISVKYFLSYNAKPLHFFGIIGFFTMLPGLVVASSVTAYRLLFHANIAPRIPSLIFSALSILMGWQMMVLGLLADLMIRSSKESAKGLSRDYLIQETIGL